MCEPEIVLRDWLLEDEGIAVVSGIYPKLIPLGAALPAVAYQRTASNPKWGRGNKLEKERVRVMLAVSAERHGETRTLIGLIKKRIKNFTATGCVRRMWWVGDSDLPHGFVTENEPSRLDVMMDVCS